MVKAVFLDSGVLGELSNPNNGQECRGWALNLKRKGTLVIIPEIADYETRRELLRAGGPGVACLEELIGHYGLESMDRAAFLQAALYWSQLRNTFGAGGTGNTLDADVLIAGQARVFAEREGAQVTIATTNTRHFATLVDTVFIVGAEHWQDITP